jgi:excisionase family DNA binding protein
MAKWTVTVEEAASLLGVGRTAGYEAARSGTIPTIRIGRRLVVPTAALEKLLSASPGSLLQETPSGSNSTEATEDER